MHNHSGIPRDRVCEGWGCFYFLSCLIAKLQKSMQFDTYNRLNVTENTNIIGFTEAILYQIGCFFMHCIKGGVEPMNANLCCRFV